MQHFGEVNERPCGICSVCKKKGGAMTEKEAVLASAEITDLLGAGPATSRGLVEKSIFAKEQTLKVLQLMMAKNKIALNTKNEYYLK
ncbi:MAG: hypothetical protein ACPGU0_04790 [Marinirhabdus sp.]